MTVPEGDEMSELERLDEAIDAYEQWGLVGFYDFAESNYNGTVALFAAARAYRDLLANGERVEWCVEHGSVVRDGWLTCLHAFFAANVKTECRPASRLLVDPPKEEER